MPKLNVISIVLVCTFLLPIITGAVERLSRTKIRLLLWNLVDNLEFLIGIFLSIHLTRKVFFEQGHGIYSKLFAWLPAVLRSLLYGQDVLTYVLVVPVVLLIILFVLRLITGIFYHAYMEALAGLIYSGLEKTGRIAQTVFAALAELPRAAFWVFVLGLVLNFYVYYFPSMILSKWMNESSSYQALYNNALYPVLNSNIAKKIPVLINDSFGRTAQRIPWQPGQDQDATTDQTTPAQSKNSIRIIEYFNGVTLDEAIKSDPAIDATARSIVGDETDSKTKAYSIYRWVSRNISYDYSKAAQVSSNPSGISSGAIIAFTTKKGICFDYSSLYIAMCRAVGVKVRMITGLGYSGVAWGDHAWNQIYAQNENRWINVDTTFGINGNYFDKSDFYVDHKYPEIQGEW